MGGGRSHHSPFLSEHEMTASHNRVDDLSPDEVPRHFRSKTKIVSFHFTKDKRNYDHSESKVKIFSLHTSQVAHQCRSLFRFL